MSSDYFYIVGYDVSGIQSFIFNSNRLKENIGASHIVYKILSEDLRQVIIDYAHENGLQVDVESYQKKDSKFTFIEEDEIVIEIIYIGGGNAYVAYKNKQHIHDINKRFSKLVYLNTNSLTVVTGTVEVSINDRLTDAFNRLADVLNRNKAQMIRTQPLQNISITRSDLKTGQPVIDFKDGEYLTKERICKRKIFSEANKQMSERFLPERSGIKFCFPSEFDDLVEEKGRDSFIGIIHIDGNNMGKTIRKVMDSINPDLTASEHIHAYVKTIRNVSKEVDDNYRYAFKKMIEFLADVIIKEKGTANEIQLPLRPIIINGDDITFVTRGKYALSLTEKFLELINEMKVGGKYPQSACAGIYFVHSHFPFYRAYQMAEELCSSAKKKAKAYAAWKLYEESHDKNNVDYQEADFNVGSWIDFETSYSGITTSIDSYRTKAYMLPELQKPEPMFVSKLNGKVFKQYNGYHLINRPYMIAEETRDKKFNFHAFKCIFRKLSSTWPRNKLKELRQAYVKDSLLVMEKITENKSRGRTLDVNAAFVSEEVIETGFDLDYSTPIFDVLDMLDLYEDLGGVQNENKVNASV